jgi:hypothetical protein
MLTITQKIKRHMARTRTTDAIKPRVSVTERVSTADTINEAIPLPRQTKMFGRNFVGYVQSLPPQDADKLIAALERDAEAERRQRSALGKGPAGSTSTAPDPGPEAELSAAEQILWDVRNNQRPPNSNAAPGEPEFDAAESGYTESPVGKMQRANDAHWKRTSAADAAAIARPGTPRAVQMANEKFWANQPPPAVLGGRHGKGGR